MNSQEPEHTHDPERQLARGLRATTPEFEARFDDLRRRIANEPHRRGMFTRALEAMRGHPAWLAGAVAAVVALAVVIVQRNGPRGEPAGVDESLWYAEVIALDDSLRDALVLTDPNALETISLMPVYTSGGGS